MFPRRIVWLNRSEVEEFIKCMPVYLIRAFKIWKVKIQPTDELPEGEFFIQNMSDSQLLKNIFDRE